MIKKLVSFLMLGLISISGFAQDQADDKTARLLRQNVNAFVSQHNIPGVAVELYVNGKLYEHYYGYAELASKDPVIPKTIFDLGSLSKLMTSILFAQEIDWAKMALTDPLTKYLKDLPESFNKINLQDLATHTAGLPFEVPDKKSLSAWTSDHLAQNRWQYSNVGMGLLGQALATSTESEFGDLYRRHILNPLGMVNGVTIPKPLIKYYAQGYDERNNPLAHGEAGTFYTPAYGIKASAADMQKFLAAAIGLPGTPPRVLYPMKLTQSIFVKLPDVSQGLGWQVHAIDSSSDIKALLQVRDLNFGSAPVSEVLPRSFYSGKVLADKTGASNGFRAYIAVIPDKKSGIVILLNKNVSSPAVVKMAREILFRVC